MAKTKNLFEELAKDITPSRHSADLVSAVQRESAEIPGWTKSTWGKSTRSRPEVSLANEAVEDNDISLGA
mgnify:CR=1 FL=1